MSFFEADVIAKEQLPTVAMLYTPPTPPAPIASPHLSTYKRRRIKRPKIKLILPHQVLVATRDYLEVKIKEKN